MNAPSSPRPWPVIAIDGGAGTGKTTSAQRVARRMGFCYIDSGAIFRLIALALREAGIQGADDERISQVVPEVDLRIDPSAEACRVYLGTRLLGEELRTPEIARLSSQIAVRADVRRRVREILRRAALAGPLVVEGRDIGTAVFPDAPAKFFLTAELLTRAERRRLDLERQGLLLRPEEVARDLEERDRRDSSRELDPLRQAEDAVLIDTTRTDIEGQVSQIVEAARARLAAQGGGP